MPGFTLLSLRVALLASLLLVASATGTLAQQRIGVLSAVNPDATGAPPGATARRLVIGQDAVFNERITTAVSRSIVDDDWSQFRPDDRPVRL